MPILRRYKMKKRIMHMKFFAPGWMSQNEKRALRSVRRLKPNDYAITTAALEAPLASRAGIPHQVPAGSATP